MSAPTKPKLPANLPWQNSGAAMPDHNARPWIVTWCVSSNVRNLCGWDTITRHYETAPAAFAAAGERVRGRGLYHVTVGHFNGHNFVQVARRNRNQPMPPVPEKYLLPTQAACVQ